jgi:proteic killer suppression protein
MKIQINRLAEKQILKAPKQVQEKVAGWLKLVISEGLSVVRQIKSYHDEPLKGQRASQRSVRLNKQWRLIYQEATGEVIEVKEVTPHDYRVR